MKSSSEAVADRWRTVSLGHVADIRLGKMLSAKAREPGLTVLPYLRNENVRWGHIDTSDVKSMGFKPSELERYRVEPGDLLVCEGGEPGRAAVYSGPPKTFMYQKALHRVRVVREAVSAHYLRYFFEHFASRLKTSQTTIAHFPLEKMEALEVPLPSLREQEEIVAEIDRQFTRLDAGVEVLKRLQAHLRRYRAALLDSAITGRLVRSDPSTTQGARGPRESGVLLLSQLRDKTLVESRRRKASSPNGPSTPVPDGWGLGCLGDFLTIRSGFAFKSSDYVPEGAALIRQSNLIGHKVSVADAVRLPRSFLTKFSDFTVNSGDLLVGMSGSLGTLSEYVEAEPALQNQRTGLVRLSPLVDRDWAILAIQWSGSRIRQLGKGVAVQNVSASEIESCPCPIPGVPEQRMIASAVAERLSVLEAVDSAAVVGATRAARLRKAILCAAFAGQLANR